MDCVSVVVKADVVMEAARGLEALLLQLHILLGCYFLSGLMVADANFKSVLIIQ